MNFIVIIFDYNDKNIVLYESNISALSVFTTYTLSTTSSSSIYINSINFIHFDIVDFFVTNLQDANSVFANLNKRAQTKDIDKLDFFRRRLKKQLE